jgi:hypothetical protein
MGMAQSEHGRLGVAAGEELEEGEPSGFGVELSGESDGFDLTVGAGEKEREAEEEGVRAGA